MRNLWIIRNLWGALIPFMAWGSAFCAQLEVDNITRFTVTQRPMAKKGTATEPLEGPAKSRRVSREEYGVIPYEGEELGLPVKDPFVLKDGTWSATEKIHKRLSKLAHERNPFAEYYLGRVLSSLGFDHKAIAYNKAAEAKFVAIIKNKKSSSFKKGIAFWYLDLLGNEAGSKEEALKLVQQSNKEHKTVLGLLYEAYLSKMNGRDGEAHRALEEATPFDARALLYRAELKKADGAFKEAVGFCVTAIRRGFVEAYELLYDLTAGAYPKISFDVVKANFQGEELNNPTDLLRRAHTASASEKLAKAYWEEKSFDVSKDKALKVTEAYKVSGSLGRQYNYEIAAEKYEQLGQKAPAQESRELAGPYALKGDELEAYADSLTQ